MIRPHILVVDDSKTAQAFLTRVIERILENPVLAVGDIDLAIEALNELEVGLIILDHHLEGVTGMDFLERKKRNSDWDDIPVLVLTAIEGDDDLYAQYISLGAVDFLTKKLNLPIIQARIVRSLESYLSAHRQRLLMAQLEEMQKRQRELLAHTLPESVYLEIMEKGDFTARNFDDTAVLFADVCNFIQYTNLNSATKLVGNLNTLVRRFEAVCDHFDLLKIKTIGDAFMAVSGVLESKADFNTTLDGAMQMIRETVELDIGWQIRIGVASGSLIGGIVGDQRMQFDVWGGSVNLAARMCAVAEPNTVAVPSALLSADVDKSLIASTADLNVKGFGEVSVSVLLPKAGDGIGSIYTGI